MAALLGPLLAAAIAAPYLVDVDAYKPALVQAVKEATGRELVIEGPMRLRMLPVPRISAQRVRFANAAGGEGAQMVDVRWIGASPSWWALLRGEVEIGQLTLYQPTIVLETDADGVPNWQFKPGAGASQAEGAPAEGFHLAIGELKVVQGTLSYTNPQTRQTIKAEQVEATARVRSLQGPLTISGKATVNGVPLSLDISMSERKADGHDLSFALQVLSGTLDFKGRISELNVKAELKGHLSVTTGVLTDFVAAIVRAGGQAVPKFDGSVAGRFVFDGGIELTPTRLAVTDFRMTMGAETASGTLALEQGAAPSLQGRIALPKIDLEKWLALLARPQVFLPAQPSAQAPGKDSPAKAPVPGKPASLSPFPVAMDVSLALDVAEVTYRGGMVRDVAVALEIHKGVITVPQLSAVLPGDMRAQATASALSVSGPRLRETLAWLGIDPSSVPSDKLQRLDLKGKIAVAGNSVQIVDMVAELDGERVTGSGSVALGPPLALAATLQADRLDLDAYLPAVPRSAPSAPLTPLPGNAATPSAATAATGGVNGAIATLIPAAPPPPDPATPVFALKAKVTKLTIRKLTLGGVEGDASMQGNLLKVTAFKVADLFGGKADAKGTVTDFATAPRYDLAFNATLPDADKVVGYAGLPKAANGKLGAASASGNVVGTLHALALRGVTATLLGSTVSVAGALALGSAFRFEFPSFNLQSQEAGRLVAAATGQSTTIGAASAAGAVKGDGQRLAFDGSLTALGTAMTGHVDATLGERPNISVNLRVPGTLDLDDWLGVSPGPRPLPSSAPVSASRTLGAATDKPIDLSALRGFDATVNLETSATQVASLRVTYADLEAKLRNGVLSIAKLTGQFYGGAVDFNGTIDATKNALAVDLKGSLQGIYFGEMLRGTAGTNSFGNDNLTVAIEGKINVMDISVQGSGRTTEEIRDTLTGRGQVSGLLFPMATKGSLGFASFATGVGSIFSTEMGFNSAVLAAFVNQQSSIAGEITIANGTVSLINQKVQGQNAVATITSHTSLMAATTDTTIALDAGRRGPADYVVTVKGPVSAPTMTTRGGN
ncbi:cell envelope biogenesis protein AsmA [Reyranella soli]|uniref:Cell envelope biogenesis protein AsmA n=1 Tax=Reyranella soli TaxID=1230389 RepID=A0A512NSD4_9HYPH|nr:cell envelope biogenesis protein AsmA [Reyranella soli]